MKKSGKIPPYIVDQAYAKLSAWERMLIDHQVVRLMGIHNVGPGMAREIVAHIGVAMEEMIHDHH